MRDGFTMIGAAAFSYQTGSINFLAVHPQYRHYGIAKAFLDYVMYNLLIGREISITTFREGDKADTGQREECKRLGFAESELLTGFGFGLAVLAGIVNLYCPLWPGHPGCCTGDRLRLLDPYGCRAAPGCRHGISR